MRPTVLPQRPDRPEVTGSRDTCLNLHFDDSAPDVGQLGAARLVAGEYARGLLGVVTAEALEIP